MFQTGVENFFEKGYKKAIDLLYKCSRPGGFIASPSDISNYQRVWGRDSVIIGLAALLSGEIELIKTFRESLETLANNQGPHGEIPSNVNPKTGRVSYGSMAGRVDSDLWFVIGCAEYLMATEDDAFLDFILPIIEKVYFLLGAWEFNTRGLLYIPATGDWADEYIHNGYILYDQLLYLQTLRSLTKIREMKSKSLDVKLIDRIFHLKNLIRGNYWFDDGETLPEHVYHEILYKKGKKAAKRCISQHWLSFFSPHGYGYRFDGLANVLVSLFNVATDNRREKVDQFISELTADNEIKLLPAFYPVITPVDEDWKDLNITFSYTFKNKPYEYHNGGLWQMITGFYIADLCKRNKIEMARQYLKGIHIANALEMNSEEWSFPEFINGKKFEPGGTQYQGWSAAAAIIGQQTLNGIKIFRIEENEK